MNRAMPERLRTLRHCIFTGRVTPSVIACGDATFPKGTAFGGGDKVSGIAIRRPLGGAGERSEPEGVTFGGATSPPLDISLYLHYNTSKMNYPYKNKRSAA